MSESEKKKSGGLMKKLGLVLLVLVVAGGAAAGGYLWSQKSAGIQAAGPVAAEAQAPPPVAAATGLVALEPFLVNLADADAGRFLRVSMSLVVADEAAAKAVTGNSVVLMRVRSALLELLTEQTAAALVTPDGKNALKTLIQERAAEVAGVAVADVLFADFVVQF